MFNFINSRRFSPHGEKAKAKVDFLYEFLNNARKYSKAVRSNTVRHFLSFSLSFISKTLMETNFKLVSFCSVSIPVDFRCDSKH